MCGIVGILSKNKIYTSVIKSMNDSIIHRGPDDEGYLIGGSIENDVTLVKCTITESPYPLAFGHRRLAIIDLSPRGHQPMYYHDRYWIIYNGEVYNHIELRKDLKALGYSFHSNSDTEVIMASYDAWGPECLNRFNGMWAFVIYDKQKGKIFISRDRFGIKPLYYFQDEKHFIFASEIKALLKHPSVTNKPNIGYCSQFLKEGPKEFLRETAFKDIYRFGNACFLECSVEDLFQPFKEIKYWVSLPNISEEHYDEEKNRKYAKRYYEILSDAVRIRMKADVKIGSALSGGLDSSSIVYLINQQLKEEGKEEKQETFSCIYKTHGTEHCDESDYIDEVAKSLNVKSNKVEPKVEEVIKEFRKVVYFFDTPTPNTLMSSWHTYKLTKKGNVTVTLDGQGADEQLAGYLRYMGNYLPNVSFSTMLREVIALRDIPGSLKIIIFGSLLNIIRNFMGKKITLSILRIGNLNIYLTPLNQKLCEDLENDLINLFHYSDSGSMAFSLESRMPFMDYRLVEFLADIPATYKIHGGWTKYISRMAFNHRLSDKICWRKDKMGWPIPEEFWFNGKLKDHFVETLKNAKFLSQCGVHFSDKSEKDILLGHSFTFLLRCYSLETWFSVFWET